MKKPIFFILLILSFLLMASCSKESANNGNNQDDIVDSDALVDDNNYEGLRIKKITYKTVDYFGGATTTSILDLESNEYLISGYTQYDEEAKMRLVSTFSDEDEEIFLDNIYKSGLLKIKDNYKTTDIIMDGGGWTLIIEFDDGTEKTSDGDNDGPYELFNKCAIYFYDLCGSGVIGYLSEEYFYPQDMNMCVFFRYYEGNNIHSHNGWSTVYTVEYKWYKKILVDNDVFDMCDSKKTEFLSDKEYFVSFTTGNYFYELKFSKFVLYSYDYNKELTNERKLYECGWFSQIDLELEMDKIYVFELFYDNGNYVKYAFSTKLYQ